MDSMPSLELSVFMGWLQTEELETAWNTINLACKWFVLSYTMAATCLFFAVVSGFIAFSIHLDRGLD